MSKEYVVLSNISQRQVFIRRLKLFGLVFISVLFASIKWAEYLPTDLPFWIKGGLILLFVLTFGWISLFFWSALFGFIEILRNRKMPGIKRVPVGTPLTTKTVVLMPVYNEDPVSVYSNLLAMARDLEKTGQGKAFDFFVLSDTTKPDVWIKEEILWLKTKELFPKNISLFYRHRPKNTARKSGNIEDFCVRFGASYDFMVVLDADSLMAGQTLVKMAQLMEANETTGIIQAPPMIINRHSLFARVQQFAGRVYGPIVTAGLAYWQVWDSNYWGHNAIIRTKAFIDCCGLPVFKGQAPFGGPILSHDFVEAALIRRGGWLAWMLPELKGSYEECPPSMLDFALRDRRWCQGNLQHFRILFSQKFHPVSRIHFALGIMSYLSSPLWFLFLSTGLGIALWRAFYPPEYFIETKTLFPTWPVFDLIGTVLLFLLSMIMLFLPKFLGLIVVLVRHKNKKDYGGTLHLLMTVFLEIIFSALIAPVMMLFQTRFVFDIFMGIDSGWNAQNREETGTPWVVAFKRHFFHTLIGIGVCLVTYLYTPSLFYWLLPITIGLILSVPLSVFSSRETLGKWIKNKGFFVVPEEVHKPSILKAAEGAFTELSLSLKNISKTGISLLIEYPLFRALHVYLLSVNGPAPDFEMKTIRSAELCIKTFIGGGDLNLTAEEMKYCLYNPRLLAELALFKEIEQG